MLVRRVVSYERLSLDCNNCGEMFRPVRGRVSGHRGWYRSIRRLCGDAKARDWKVEVITTLTNLLDVKALCGHCAEQLDIDSVYPEKGKEQCRAR